MLFQTRSRLHYKDIRIKRKNGFWPSEKQFSEFSARTEKAKQSLLSPNQKVSPPNVRYHYQRILFPIFQNLLEIRGNMCCQVLKSLLSQGQCRIVLPQSCVTKNYRQYTFIRYVTISPLTASGSALMSNLCRSYSVIAALKSRWIGMFTALLNKNVNIWIESVLRRRTRFSQKTVFYDIYQQRLQDWACISGVYKKAPNEKINASLGWTSCARNQQHYMKIIEKQTSKAAKKQFVYPY